MGLTQQAGPSPTPTGLAEPLPPATRVPTPTPQSLPAPPLSDAPWLVYCSDGLGQSVLVAADGQNQVPLGWSDCIWHEAAAPARGYAAVQARGRDAGGIQLVQFPGAEVPRMLPIQGEVSWSPGGRYLAIFSRGDDSSSAIYVYDLELDHLREVARHAFELYFSGWSPDGKWIVYAVERSTTAPPLGELWAVTSDGAVNLRLYEVDSGDYPGDFIQGWLSEVSFVASRAVEFCHLAMMHVNLVTRSATMLVAGHGEVAVDPETDTILFESTSMLCAGAEEPGVYRMTVAGGWRPQLLIPESADLQPDLTAWIPELRRFSVCQRGVSAEGQDHALLTPAGVSQFWFACGEQLIPSPDGRRALLVNRQAETVKLFDASTGEVTELGQLAVRQAVWLPDSEGYFILTDKGDVYRSPLSDWGPPQLQARGADPSWPLFIMQPATRLYWQACEGAAFSRLAVGDRAEVSEATPTANRLRDAPGLQAGRSLGLIAPGEGLVVLEGPACSDGLVWWRVRVATSGLEGWTAEGDMAGAWLLPSP